MKFEKDFLVWNLIATNLCPSYMETFTCFSHNYFLILTLSNQRILILFNMNSKEKCKFLVSYNQKSTCSRLVSCCHTMHIWNTEEQNVILHGAEFFLETLKVVKLTKKLPTLYGSQRFVIVLKARHLYLLQESTFLQSISLRSTIVLSSHLCLGLSRGLFHSDFPSFCMHQNINCLRQEKWFNLYHVCVHRFASILPPGCV